MHQHPVTGFIHFHNDNVTTCSVGLITMVYGLWIMVLHPMMCAAKNYQNGVIIYICIYIYMYIYVYIYIYHSEHGLTQSLWNWIWSSLNMAIDYIEYYRIIVFATSQGTSAWGRCTQRANPCVREWAPWQQDSSPLVPCPFLENNILHTLHVCSTSKSGQTRVKTGYTRVYTSMISVWISHDITQHSGIATDNTHALAKLTH